MILRFHAFFARTLVVMTSLWFAGVAWAADWPQDAGDAQRTGFTRENPAWPWTFAWAWNGPDENGGTNAHRYHQPKRHEPWEARVVVGGGLALAPAGELGLFALRLADGAVAWQFTNGTCQAAAAFDASARAVFLGTAEGLVYQLDASTGRPLAQFDAGAPVNKALLLANETLFALNARGDLCALNTRDLTLSWRYSGAAQPATLAAYSSARNSVVFCTEDLQVHCVNASDGKSRWRIKPTPLASSDGVSFTGGWPVIAERTGVVFVRLAHGGVDATLWSGGGPKGKWPTNNAAIRERLISKPRLKNLFALRLEDGSEAFVPAVGPAGVEDMRGGKPWLRVHSFPVVRIVDGSEVAYLPFRNGDTRDANWDGRWDSHLGEMVLDDGTIPNLHAGDFRFVQFQEYGGWVHITDESCPLTIAHDTIFYAHWDSSNAARIIDRSPARGLTRSTPIRTEKRPPVARHLRLSAQRLNAQTHWAEGGLQLVDGRYLDGPGWWVYANELDPPTPTRDAYSEGILPRYTFAADGHIIIQGNGGDLFVLKHSGGQ